MLKSLRTRSFRNLRDQIFRPVAGRQLVLGANGAGKTSLLEAIYMLATTRSFRANQLADCCRHGDEVFFLEGEVWKPERLSLEMAWAEGSRHRSVNGKRVRLSEHLAVLPVVAWTAAEAEVIDGPPAVRRRLLDRGVVGSRPAALEVLWRYRRVLAQKRELLRQGTATSLEPWNTLLAGAAAQIVACRRRYVEQLQRRLADVGRDVQIAVPAVTLRYRPSPAEAVDGCEEEIFEILQRLAGQEKRVGLPLAGPHRDRLELFWGDREVQRVASAGEKKALGLMMVAAQGRALEGAGRTPLYLLDDADTELDTERVGALWRLFSSQDQVFASSSRRAVWEGLEAEEVWVVESGTAVPQRR